MIFRHNIMRSLYRKCFRLVGLNNYAKIDPALFFINLFFQRILGRNSKVNFQVNYTSFITGVEADKVSNSFKLSCAISGSANIGISSGTNFTVDDGTIFAQNFCVRTANHDFMDRTKFIKGDVSIGKNCWFGHGAVVLPNVNLGDNVTIGANCVVTKSFPSNVVIAGIPAKIIRNLNEK